MERVFEGSVAMARLEEHGDEVCIVRFCSGGMDSGNIELECVF